MTAVFPIRLPVCLLFSPSLWTPPMPPVTKTGMPARCAAIIVADTVVPPESPWKNTVQDSVQTLPWMTCDVCDVCERVSLCWGRRADHDGTPSGSSCSGQGGRAPLTTGRHGLHPLSLPPWLEWLLRLSQWPPPPLLCCIKTLTVLNASKKKKFKNETLIDTWRLHHKVPQVVWIGHAMCDDGALQCDHWFVFCQSLWYQWMNSEEAV